MVLSTPAASICWRKSSAGAGLELRSFEEHAERMLDKGAHGGDALDVVEAGADDVFRMGEDQTLDAAPLAPPRTRARSR